MKNTKLHILFITTLLVCNLNAQNKQPPTIDKTISFIQKVIKDDSLSSSFKSDGETYYKPTFKHLGECKFEIIQKNSFDCCLKDILYPDLSIHKIYLKRNSFMIVDRSGLKTLEVHDYSFGNKKTENVVHSGGLPYIIIHGVYKGKIKKALEHLSNICYDRYGKKDNEPF